MSTSPRAADTVLTGPTVHGLDLSPLTQCTHWHSPRDIIAIKHKCCEQYYGCISCHQALATHANQVWPRSTWTTTRAVLCGNCRTELTIAEYLGCSNSCPRCEAEFNPGCARHYHLYFEKQQDEESQQGPEDQQKA